MFIVHALFSSFASEKKKLTTKKPSKVSEREHAFRIVAQRICTMLYCGQKYSHSEIYIMYRLCIHEVRECFAIFQPFCCLFCTSAVFFVFVGVDVFFRLSSTFYFREMLCIFRNLDGDDTD